MQKTDAERKREREARIAEERQRRELEELNECSFQPRTNHDVPREARPMARTGRSTAVKPVVVRGLARHLELKRHANKLAEEHRTRVHNAFHVAKADEWRDGRRPGAVSRVVRACPIRGGIRFSTDQPRTAMAIHRQPGPRRPLPARPGPRCGRLRLRRSAPRARRSRARRAPRTDRAARGQRVRRSCRRFAAAACARWPRASACLLALLFPTALGGFSNVGGRVVRVGACRRQRWRRPRLAPDASEARLA